MYPKQVTMTNTLTIFIIILIVFIYACLNSSPVIRLREYLNRKRITFNETYPSYWQFHSVRGVEHFNFKPCLDLYDNELTEIHASDIATVGFLGSPLSHTLLTTLSLSLFNDQKCCSLSTFRNCVHTEAAKTCLCASEDTITNITEMLVKTMEGFLSLEDYPNANCTGHTTADQCTYHPFKGFLLPLTAFFVLLTGTLVLLILVFCKEMKENDEGYLLNELP